MRVCSQNDILALKICDLSLRFRVRIEWVAQFQKVLRKTEFEFFVQTASTVVVPNIQCLWQERGFTISEIIRYTTSINHWTFRKRWHDSFIRRRIVFSCKYIGLLYRNASCSGRFNLRTCWTTHVKCDSFLYHFEARPKKWIVRDRKARFLKPEFLFLKDFATVLTVHRIINTCHHYILMQCTVHVDVWISLVTKIEEHVIYLKV